MTEIKIKDLLKLLEGLDHEATLELTIERDRTLIPITIAKLEADGKTLLECEEAD